MSEREITKLILKILQKIVSILHSIGVRVFIIGARASILLGINLDRETGDWGLTIDKQFTVELRDIITSVLRENGFKVQLRKWGFFVTDGMHVDINYAPLVMDNQFIERSKEIMLGLYLLSIEDLIVLKLMSGERKDKQDLKKMLAQTWLELDKKYLFSRTKQAGLEKELEKILRRLKLK